jgi:hypothetical protein
MTDETQELAFISAGSVLPTNSNYTWRLQPFFLGVAPTREI